MIIKKINIINFGGIKNKTIKLNNGINVIYGLNEAGKSTIQSFIKVWLYGFSNYRGKDISLNERAKYSPMDGSNISGELYLEIDGKDLIISRTFGRSKKDDTSVIIDGISGQKIEDVNKDEPGKSFLNINRSTFIKTLFIGQLDVEVKKDKEEELIDKISSSVGIGEGEVSIDKAFLKLDNYKKSLSNIRKNGTLDILKDRHSELISEKYEAYEMSKVNLDKEKLLLELKEDKNKLVSELDNLDIYKKYLKKIQLQKEYKDITKYLIKKENLQSKEKEINHELTYNNEIINTDLLDMIREEYYEYESFLKEKTYYDRLVNEKVEVLSEVKKPIIEIQYIEAFSEEEILNLERLKIKQEILKEKVNLNKKIENEIKLIENEKIQKRSLIGDYYKLNNVRDAIGNKLKVYEEKLIELKGKIENRQTRKYVNTKVVISSLLTSIVLIILSLVITNPIIKTVLYTIVVLAIILFILTTFKSSKEKKYNKEVENLKNDVINIEEELDKYINEINVQGYEELIKAIKIYDEYIVLENNYDNKINEKRNQQELLNLIDVEDEYYGNEKYIQNYIIKSGKYNLDEILSDYKMYKNYMKEFVEVEAEVKNIVNKYNRLCDEVIIKEEKLRRDLEKFNLANVDLNELGIRLEEVKNKIRERQEIQKTLNIIDETYATLTKNKDIDFIKEELKNIVNVEVNYKYNTEEEIDLVLKNKNLELREVEKQIKDVENYINNRFKGRRTISKIEEEIENVYENLKNQEKILKAIEIAKEKLSKSYDEIRESFGPVLNREVNSYFKTFTNDKYEDVKVSDSYEIKVKAKDSIISSKLLSNGANDQLFLALRLAFIKMIFKNKNISIYLDDAFVQYDDNRVRNILLHLSREEFKQILIFTCQNREVNILKEKSIDYNYIKL